MAKEPSGDLPEFDFGYKTFWFVMGLMIVYGLLIVAIVAHYS